MTSAYIYFRSLPRWIALGAVCLVSAEVASRVDDAIRLGIPLLHSPDRNSLTVCDYFGVRGRPFARYQKWHLNNFGFRGTDIQLAPTPNRRRVMILGASETFGLYESPEHDFPARLADDLGTGFEVINAAIPGMTLATMTNFWEHWAVQFKPEIVVIYPSPQFYLAANAFERKQIDKESPRFIEPEHFRITSRFFERLLDVVEKPDFIQRRLNKNHVDAATAGQSADWLFVKVPEERLELFGKHLDKLVHMIEQSGARPVLLTHALRTGSPPSESDLEQLESARVHIPRATAQVISDFEAAVDRQVASYAESHQIPLVDIAGHVGGRPENFMDIVHFSDIGAAAVAREIADILRNLKSL